MVDVVLSVIKLKPDKINRLKKWCEELNKRKGEVVETMKREGIYTESAFLHRTEDGDFLIYYIEAEDFERAMEVFYKSEKKIDREHRRVLEEVSDDQHFRPVLLFHFKSKS